MTPPLPQKSFFTGEHKVTIRTRRQFLAASRNFAAAAATAAVLPRMAWASPMGLPIGIQLYAVRDRIAKDTPGALKELHDIGYREVETAGFGKYSPAEFRKLLDDAGLKAPSCHLNLNAADLGPAFTDAHTIGAQYATSSSLATGNLPPRPAGAPRMEMQPLGLDGFTKLAEQMNGIGAKAKAAGLQYAYHNHNYEFEKMPDGSYGYDVLGEEHRPQPCKVRDRLWMDVCRRSEPGPLLQDISRALSHDSHQGLSTRLHPFDQPGRP